MNCSSVAVHISNVMNDVTRLIALRWFRKTFPGREPRTDVELFFAFLYWIK